LERERERVLGGKRDTQKMREGARESESESESESERKRERESEKARERARASEREREALYSVILISV